MAIHTMVKIEPAKPTKKAAESIIEVVKLTNPIIPRSKNHSRWKYKTSIPRRIRARLVAKNPRGRYSILC
ncbi:hypothetical protein CAT723_04870 [Corynebacterium ammoniagenes]|uniref:Uncharacterized protein n=1 Tax=Corynebacterium ammoniagenes TaxID=1697 RepID=A0AAV5G5P8_CORAM|nr:hypothetical protein CAT723_04870 [Corynebacterium ammoniagenes]